MKQDINRKRVHTYLDGVLAENRRNVVLKGVKEALKILAKYGKEAVRYSESEDYVNIKVAVDLLRKEGVSISQTDFLKWLQAEGFLSEHLRPTKKSVQAKLLRVVVEINEEESSTNYSVEVTYKGLRLFVKLMKNACHE